MLVKAASTYLLYVVIFWIILPLMLFFVGIRLIDPLVYNFLNFSTPAVLIKISPFLGVMGLIIYFSSFHELLKIGQGLPVSAIPPVKLVETGCYFYFRHPLYLGFQFMLISVAMFVKSIGALIVTGPLFLILWIVYASVEERILIVRYGNVYKRYREETGLFVPSLYAIARLIIMPLLRILFNLRLENTHCIPLTGSFYVISLHRSYLDPIFISAGINRKVHFLTTSSMFRKRFFKILFRRLHAIPVDRFRNNVSGIRETLKVLDSGGIIGLFPEGGRSWYGETAYAKSALRIIEKHPLPIVTADIIDNFSFYPRFSNVPKKEQIRVIFRYYKKNSIAPENLVRMLYQREHKRDLQERKRKVILDARGIEELIYFCPYCGNLFPIKGEKNGLVKCRICGKGWKLFRGKILEREDGRLVELKEIELYNIEKLKYFHQNNISFTCKCSINFSYYHNAVFSLNNGKIKITTYSNNKNRKILAFHYREIYSVVIEGNRKFEVSFKRNGKRYYLIFLMPQHTALFLQYLLRLQAFANPYTRYSGSLRYRC